MPFCKVNQCRFNNTHVTKAHVCGKCGDTGHGQIECGNQDMIDALEKLTDPLPEQFRCKFEGCDTSEEHTTQGHVCLLCSKYGHPEYNCDLSQNVKIKCSQCQAQISYGDIKKLFGFTIDCPVCLEKSDNTVAYPCGHGMCSVCNERQFVKYYSALPLTQESDASAPIVYECQDDMIETFNKYSQTNPNHKHVYIDFNVGMGCICFIRRKDANSPIECFFMHTDSWGQYGPTTDNRPYLAVFLSKYHHVRNNYEVGIIAL